MRQPAWLNIFELLLSRRSASWIPRRLMRPPQPAAERVSVQEGYRLWASSYASETVACFLDDAIARDLLRRLPRSRLLDAGCGAGDRIRDIPGAVGLDLSPEMLAAGGLQNVVVGDIRAMPFKDSEFDMIWCRLVLGYVEDPLPAYRELCRVCAPGGYVFVTDFHADAIAAGHRRTFNDEHGVPHEIESYIHTDHEELAAKVGLRLEATRNGSVGPSVRHFYLQGLGQKAYLRDFGLNLVRAYLFRRPIEASMQGLVPERTREESSSPRPLCS